MCIEETPYNRTNTRQIGGCNILYIYVTYLICENLGSICYQEKFCDHFFPLFSCASKMEPKADVVNERTLP